MGQIDTSETILSETEAEQNSVDGDGLKLVPVAESIRYRKRAQSAEKTAQAMSEQLAEVKSQAAQVSEQLKNLQVEQKLMRKLAAAGAVDLETAVLIAKARVEAQDKANLDDVIDQLKKEKQYLFGNAGEAVTTQKTASVRQRIPHSQAVLESAAKRAATTGNRADLQQYLKLRRSHI